MSLVTDCPACGTRFRVKPEQLAAHRGDVRCGKCDYVFNALERLDQTSPDRTSFEPLNDGLLEHPSASDEGQTAAAEYIRDVATDEIGSVGDEIVPENDEPVIEQPAFDQTEILLMPPLESPYIDVPDSGQIDFVVDAEPSVEDQPEPEPEPEPERSMVDALASTVNPSPVPAFQTRRKFSWLSAISALLFLLLATAQLSYFLRSELAAHQPPLRPYLEQACSAIGCTVDLPGNIKLLSIDDSDLQEDIDHQDVIVLTSTIINHADFVQAYPMVELTLTDLDDRPLLRRIFTPKEYLQPQHDLDGGIQPGEELRISLRLLPEGIRATGYRVYLTYP